MKILKHKNIMGLIYSALLCMPLLAIGVRSAYVICNKNAYQSYYGTTINEVEYNLVSNIDNLQLNERYLFNSNDFDIKDTTLPQGSYSRGIYVANCDNINTSLTLNSNNIKAINPYIDSNSRLTVMLEYSDAVSQYIYITSNNDYLSLTFDYMGNNLNYNFAYNDLLYSVEVINFSTLDNVFEYSVNKFVSENNLGQINMFSWFTNLFLSYNATNNLYVGFANWYMNYAMLISCMHLLFLVLMWFVNYSRRLLDRGMNYDW